MTLKTKSCSISKGFIKGLPKTLGYSQSFFQAEHFRPKSYFKENLSQPKHKSLKLFGRQLQWLNIYKYITLGLFDSLLLAYFWRSFKSTFSRARCGPPALNKSWTALVAWNICSFYVCFKQKCLNAAKRGRECDMFVDFSQVLHF